MGQTQTQIKYSIPINDLKEGESQIYRNPKSINQLQWQPEPHIFTLQDAIENGNKRFKDLEFQGSFNTQTNKFEYITYGQTYELARSLGSAFILQNLYNELNEYKSFKLKVIGIYSKNRPEWNIADMACSLYGITSIPLYDTLGPEAISYALDNSSISSLICSEQSVQTVLKTEAMYKLKNLILLDDINEELKQKIQEKGLQYFFYNDLIEQGRQSIVPLPKIYPEDIFTFSYTSGTTGLPKGAMISHQNFVGLLANFCASKVKLDETDVQMCYLPLAHIFQRALNVLSWYLGMKIAFFRGNILQIKDDLQLIKPTFFFSVPRIFNKFYHAILDQFKQKTFLLRKLIDLGITRKLQNYQYYGLTKHQVFDALIFNKIKQFFGGKVKFLLTGSAPLSKDVLDFFKIALGVPFLEVYGQTEGTGLEFMTDPDDKHAGHVGGIQLCLEFKVTDVPEMNYYSTDKDENGLSMPRGEICVRGFTIFPGYYKEDEKTKEAIDNEGWLHSGDIGIILPNGSLQIIDRKKNIFKLSQGEYIAPEKVETIYLRMKSIQEIFVYGDPFQNFCVGIVVPNPDEVKQIAKNLNIQNNGDLNELCQNQKIIDCFQNSMNEHAKKEKLFGFEQPQKIYLEPVSMLIHGCMTNTMKIQRNQAKTHFKDIINKLYN